MATPGAIEQSPWELAAGHHLSDLLSVGTGPTKAKCKWRSGKIATDDEMLGAAAWLIAEIVMRLRCGETDKFPLWRRSATGEHQPTATDQATLKAFIQPSFGLPSAPGSEEHLQGAVSEHVWFQLTKEATETGRELKRLEEPGMYVTSPGGDGLAVYEGQEGLSFRLWEIKKSIGSSGVSPAVKRAYDQLLDNATRYLAQYTATGQHFSDPDLKVFYAQLVDLWVNEAASAGAGVSVSTSHGSVPARCFSTMHRYFPALDGDGQLEGLVAGLGDFAVFSQRVRQFLWSAL